MIDITEDVEVDLADDNRKPVTVNAHGGKLSDNERG